MTDGGPRTWKLLCGLGACRAAWEAHAEPPAYEETAFPVRVQSKADLAVRVQSKADLAARVQSKADLAARDPWRIEAWENPFARDGPASPFLAGEPMLEGAGGAACGVSCSPGRARLPAAGPRPPFERPRS